MNCIRNGITVFVMRHRRNSIMVGDKGFEFYNTKRVEDCIQIPWDEMEYVIASVLFQGKYIPRIAIRTRQGAIFSFAARHPKILLQAVRPYVDDGHMVRSLGFFDVLKRSVCSVFSGRDG